MVKTQKADLLAQELAHTFSQFRRLGPPKVSLHGFKPVEFFLLATLIESTPPGAACLKTSDLSTRLQVTPAAVTHVINNLEKAGYVERVADPADRRIVLLKPTQAGLKMMEVANARFLKLSKGLVEFLGIDDSREFIRLVSLVMTYFKKETGLLKD